MKTETEIGAETGAWSLIAPTVDRIPLVFDSPHSWPHWPEDFDPVVDNDVLFTSLDAFVDELFGRAPDVGAPLLAARFPRFYLDANRARDDIDPDLLSGPYPEPINPTDKSEAGMGLIRRLGLPGHPIYGRKLSPEEVKSRVERCYDPYHGKLSELISESADQFGFSVHIDCHSMKSVGNAMNEDAGKARPDFVVSDTFGLTSSADWTNLVADLLRKGGYNVLINDPYKGAELIRRFSDPAANRHSIQIEVNRAIYMDEARFEKSGEFDKVRADLDTFVDDLAAAVKAA